MGAWERLARQFARGRRSDKAGVRKLAEEVFTHRDPIAVAVKLLDSDRPTVAARVWERLLEYRFGRPAQMIEASGPGGGPVVVKIVSHVPRPARREGLLRADRATPVQHEPAHGEPVQAT